MIRTRPFICGIRAMSVQFWYGHCMSVPQRSQMVRTKLFFSIFLKSFLQPNVIASMIPRIHTRHFPLFFAPVSCYTNSRLWLKENLPSSAIFATFPSFFFEPPTNMFFSSIFFVGLERNSASFTALGAWVCIFLLLR